MRKTQNRPITKQQGRVLVFISESTKSAGFPPTYREVMDALDLSSTNAVSGHLEALEHKGYITTLRGKARAMFLTEMAKEYVVNLSK